MSTSIGSLRVLSLFAALSVAPLTGAAAAVCRLSYGLFARGGQEFQPNSRLGCLTFYSYTSFSWAQILIFTSGLPHTCTMDITDPPV